MTLRQLLLEKREVIARRWLGVVLATYPGDSGAVFASEKDPFANPVGHSLRMGTERILDVLLEGTDDEGIRESLYEIMKIRAVQQFAPSQAVEFVFRLKDVVRAELGGAVSDPQYSRELGELDAQIDEITLAAFDAYVECREQVHQLRINEVKRQVSWVIGKVNQQDPEPELVQIESKRDGGNVQREGLR
ncbi:MAG: hypothetical protein AMS21_03620 [Gemmatimonas sp. SG8_38_2]|nr:MAG: hypothetical protein AMS21_03620 [Gemmatimonas sp. SG8_38_2]